MTPNHNRPTGTTSNGAVYDISNDPIIQSLQLELSKVTSELVRFSKERDQFSSSTTSIEADRKKREEEINIVNTKLHSVILYFCIL
jgi:septal ring factor EnvC (AmiA/AmiB activator)